MAELNITVRDRHGQAASQKVAVGVTPPAPASTAPASTAPAAPIAPPREAAPPRRTASPADTAAPARYTESLQAPPRRVSHMRRRMPMGQILVQAGLLSEAQLERALQEQKQTGERLGRVILSMGLASQDDIARAIAKQLSIDFVNLSDALLEEDVLLRIPEQIARRHHVIPIAVDNGSLVLGMEDPLDVVALDDLRKLTGLEIRPAVITPDAFQRALSQYPVGMDQTLAEIRPTEAYEEEIATERLRAVAEDAPIVRLANGPGDSPGCQRHPRRAAGAAGAHPLPHRRDALLGDDAAQARAGRPGLPHQDHGRHEYRRTARPAGRPH